MASSRIDVRVDGKDNTSSAFKSVSTSISKLNQEAGKAGSTIGQSINKGVQTASTSIGKLGSTASSAFQKIASAAGSAGKSISSSFDGISGALSGILGGYGLMNVAQAAWSGAVSQDFNKQFLATKMSTAAANEYVSTIQNIVAAVPGPDSWMNNLLSGAVAKQTNLSSGELRTLADMSASYYLTATGMGKSAIETQNDLNEYIKTGNTTQLERDSILKDQLPLLEGQSTVSERIAALQKAMVADGYDQVSNLNTLGNKWETFSGLIGKAATSLGNMVAPAIMDILNFLTDLDSTTGGWSTKIGLVGVAIAGLVSSLAVAAPLVNLLLSPWKSIASGIVTATTKMWAYVVAAKAADKADDGVGNSGGKGVTNTISSSIGNFLGTLGGVGVGAGIAAGASSLAMRVATGIASAFTSVAGAIIYPAIWGLFQDGSLLSGNFDLAANWAPQWNQIKTDIGGIGAYAQKTWVDIQTLGSAIWSPIAGAAAAAFGVITGAWNSLKSLVGQGARGVVSVFGPTIGSIRSAVSSLWGLVHQGASGLVRIWSSGVDAVRSAVGSLYSMVRSGAQGLVSIVKSIVGGPGGPRGPGGPSGISYHYEDYGGWQKNAWTGENSMSGNCADMTSGLINRFGGSMVSGTWNGNPHVWWKSPGGQEFDPARMALNGTGTPPPRGPSSASASGTNYIIQGDVYGWDDFVRKVEQANNKMVVGVF